MPAGTNAVPEPAAPASPAQQENQLEVARRGKRRGCRWVHSRSRLDGPLLACLQQTPAVGQHRIGRVPADALARVLQRPPQPEEATNCIITAFPNWPPTYASQD